MGLFTRTENIDAATLAQRLRERSVHLLDVRQPHEWRKGHIHGSHNVPLAQVRNRLGSLPRERTIITVCASGHRSAAAARTLRRAGYTVENLKGGMHAWARAGLPTKR